MSKRYFLSVVQEAIFSEEYRDYRAGRIEIYDTTKMIGYAIDEKRFFVPEDIYYDVIRKLDGVEFDEPFILEGLRFDE